MRNRINDSFPTMTLIIGFIGLLVIGAVAALWMSEAKGHEYQRHHHHQLRPWAHRVIVVAPMLNPGPRIISIEEEDDKCKIATDQTTGATRRWCPR